jgi:L-2-hydroxyglutarate oxidase
VIHSGLYYKPGSLKARNRVDGREALYRFCAEHGIAHERCGKVAIATHPDELPALAELERRGTANGLAGLRCPQTWIVDDPGVCHALVRLVRGAGAILDTGTRVLGCTRTSSELFLERPRAIG